MHHMYIHSLVTLLHFYKRPLQIQYTIKNGLEINLINIFLDCFTSEQVTLVQPVFTPSLQTIQKGQTDVIEKDKQSIYK